MSEFIFPNASDRYHAPPGDSALVGPHANRPGSPAAAGDLGDRVAEILVRENGGQPPSTTAVATPERATTPPAHAAPAAASGDLGDKIAALLVAENGGQPPRAA